mmetsp:Transcript_4422/g.12687  ORF Transcript_4422/g.12687 Transcript_4422/m.12687 type:complete len:170 (+) Transcript_4422:550-1059(+)
MIALCCDYRMFRHDNDEERGGSKIGLNESLLGINAPPWLAQMYVDTIGRRCAELALSHGTLYGAQQALDIGLVDQLVDYQTDDNNDGNTNANNAVIQNTSKHYVQKWITTIPQQARHGTKTFMRQKPIDELVSNRQMDNDDFCSFVIQPHVQDSLGAYIQSMDKKKRSK